MHSHVITKSNLKAIFNHFRYKKQIEDAEEIAALNLAKFRKAQQQLEEAEERTKMAELNMARLRGDKFFVYNSN